MVADGSGLRPPNRWDALLTLRGVACCLVIVAHCGPPAQSLVWAGQDWSWVLFAPGGVAVRVFFCLSGYLIGKGFYTERYRLDRPGIIRYFQSRATRILPLYYACILISATVFYPHSWQPNHWGHLLRLLTFTYEHSLPFEFNAPLWSLSTEVQFYAIAPLIFWASRRWLKTGQLLLVAMAAVTGGLMLYRFGVFELIEQLLGSTEGNPYFIRYIYTFLPANLDAFLVGFWLNPLMQKLHQNRPPTIDLAEGKTNPIEPGQRLSVRPWVALAWGRSILGLPWKGWAIGAMGLLYGLAAWWKYQGSDRVLLVAPGLTVLATGLFIFAFERRVYFSSGRNRPLSRSAMAANPFRAWELLGLLSFGLYVWHYPLLKVIGPLITNRSSLVAYGERLGLVFLGSIALASFTYWAIEVPASRWRNKAQRSPTRSLNDSNR